MRSFTTLLAGALTLIAGVAHAQVTLPWTEDFEATLVQEILVDTPSLTGAPDWEFVTSIQNEGRLRTGLYARSGTSGVTLDRDGPGALVQNDLIVTLDLSNYDVLSDVVRLDFSHLSHGDESGTGDRVWVRGADTEAWVEVYDLTSDSNLGTWADVVDVPVSSWLDTAGQNFSATTQIKFGQYDNSQAEDINYYDGRSFDEIAVRLVVPQDAGITAILTPVSGQCGLSADVVDVEVTNLGSGSIANVPVSVTLTGIASGTLTGMAIGPLAPGQSEVVTLGPVDLFGGGTVTVDATVTWGGDGQATNDDWNASAAILASEIGVTAPAPVCPGNPSTLQATPETDTVFGWYDPSGTLMGLGDSYTIAALGGTETWSVLRETFADAVGAPDTSIGNVSQYSVYSQGLVFDANQDVNIVSVDVYPTNPGDVTINLTDSQGTVLDTTTATVVGGGNAETIALGFAVSPGTGYRLNAMGTELAVGGMARNWNGASYPYTDSQGALAITGTINQLSGYYYFFYDWQLEIGPECADEETPILAATDVGVCANDLGLTLTGPTAATAGTPSAFDLVVTNTGADYAPSVTLDLPMPSGASFLSNTGACTTAFPCALGDLAAGASATVTTTVSSSLAGTMLLDAIVSSVGTETGPGDETASISVTIIGQADLSASGLGPASVPAGGSGSFTLMVDNFGASQAESTVLTISAGTGVTSSVTTGCAEDPAGVPICTLGDVASQGTAVVTVDLGIDPSATGAISLTGVASSSTAETSPGDETVTLSATVDRSADLVAGVVATPEPVLAGETLSWTLTATNNGPADATGVAGTFTPPAGVSLATLPIECGASGGDVVCVWGPLAVGASVSTSLTATVDPATTGTLAASVTVAGSETEAAAGDETATVGTTVDTAADLQVAGSATPDPATPAGNATWTFDVTNAGPSDAAGVVFDLALDADLTLVSTSGCAEDPTGAPTCTVGSLAAGATATATVEATVAATSLGPVGITATASATTAEGAVGDEVVDVEVAVTPMIDLSVALAATPDPVTAGQTLSYTLDVANAGPSEATSVAVEVVLPAEVTVATPPTECAAVAAGLECAFATLTAGGASSLTFDGAVAAAALGTLSHAASVTGTEVESDPSNDNATLDVTVGTAADLSATVESVTEDPAQGEPATWVVRVANGGPSVARDVQLGSAFTGDLNIDATVGCDEDPVGWPACTVSDALDVGASVSIVFESTVGATATGDITGTFTATMSTPESNVGDEEATATVTVFVPKGDDDDSAGDDDDATGDDDDATGDDDDATGDDDDSTVGDDDDTTGDDDDAAPQCGCTASGSESPQALWAIALLLGGVLGRRRR